MLGFSSISPFNGMGLIYDSGLVTGTLPTYTLPGKNSYSQLGYLLYYASAQPITLKLTGLTASSYDERLEYTLKASPNTLNTVGQVAVASWLNGGVSAGPGIVMGNVFLPPAPELKYQRSSNEDPTAWRDVGGYSTDVTNDPTALAFVLSGSGQYRLRVWG